MKRYPSSLDALAQVIPWGIALILLAGCTVALVDVYPEGILIMIFTSILPLAILAVVIIATRMLRIQHISVDDNNIYIERRARPVTISFAEIRSMKRITDMSFAVRTFGNGGMFGYTGMYYKKGIGSMHWYCTQRKNYILIETTDKKIVITPDDPKEFLEDVAAKHPVLIIN